MDMTLIQREDGFLSDALAGILGRLRGPRYPRFSGGAEETLQSEADEFVEKLAQHLRHSEETLFPALRRAGPGSAGDLDVLEKDHRLLGLYARRLATQIKGQGREGATGVARTFLAVLLEHLDREMNGVRRCLEFMRGDGRCFSES